MPTLTVEFEQTEQDLVEFQRHHIRRSQQRWRTFVPVGLILLAAILIGLIAGLMVFLQNQAVATLFAGFALLELVIAAMLFAFNWFLLPSFAAWRILLNQQQRTMLIGLRAIAMSEGGISWRYPAGESSVGWEAVNRVERDSGGIYVYFGPTNAIWLPLRAFRSPEAFNQFGELASDYLAQSRTAA